MTVLSKRGSKETVWFVQSLVDVVEEYANDGQYSSLLARLTDADESVAEVAFKKVEGLLGTGKAYSVYVGAIFEIEPPDDIVGVLRSRGYFAIGDGDILKAKWNAEAMIPFHECLMWAFLDARAPSAVRHYYRAEPGTDCEACLLAFVNYCVRKESHLKPLSVITQYFFGEPHFRVVLFHFLRDHALLDYGSSTREDNAAVSIATLRRLGVEPFWPAGEYRQSPLLIMCFVLRCVPVLSRVIPPKQKDAFTASSSAIPELMIQIREGRAHLAQVTRDIAVLRHNVEVARAQSARRSRRVAGEASGAGSRPRTRGEDGKESGPRVTWVLPAGSQEDQP